MSSFGHHLSTPGLNFNYSLYAVPAAWALSMAPLWWVIGSVNKQSDGSAYKNANPTESWSNLKEHLSEPVYRRAIRAVAANNNSHINLPLFASALVVGNVAHLDSTTLHLCAGGYLAVRTVYNLAYILIEDETWSWLRSVSYLSGVGLCMTLFVKSANKLKTIPW